MPLAVTVNVAGWPTVTVTLAGGTEIPAAVEVVPPPPDIEPEPELHAARPIARPASIIDKRKLVFAFRFKLL